MPFIQRDPSGKITALFDAPQPGADEELPPSHDDVLAFLLTDQNEDETKAYLSKTDAEMVRVVEDLIDLLISRNVILLTDLPLVAQKKLIARKQLRSNFQTENPVLIDGDSIL
ncbi:MAG: tryptophan synthase subunit beta like protein [Candidatus Sedimenticola sp. PURPLELP]